MPAHLSAVGSVNYSTFASNMCLLHEVSILYSPRASG